MTEELRTRRVPVTDGQTVRYVNTYVLSEYDLVNSETTDVNAFVPADAPIQPPQAFVDSITSFLDGSAAILPNKGIAHFDTGFFNNWLAGTGSGLSAFDYSGNALDAENVDSILASIAATSGSAPNGTLDISGGTNAAPTKEERYTLTAQAAIVTAPNGSVNYLDGTTTPPVPITVDTGIALAASHGSWDATGYIIGTSDTPTTDQVAAKLAALLSVNPLTHTSVVGSVITIRDFDFTHLWDYTDTVLTFFTSSEDQASDVNVLKLNGWTVAVNNP